MLRVAQRITGGKMDAEGLVQESLLRAYRAIDRFDGRHPRAWLLTILRNTWINMNRRQRPIPLDAEDLVLGIPARGADGRGGAEEQVLARVLDSELVVGLRRLPPTQMDVVVLVDIDGLAYAEAAAVLGIPEGTVMSRLHRARKYLRRHMERQGHRPTEW